MKFSVIIPIYNKAHTILSAVNSILKQNYSDYEIVLVDDGSSDDLESKLAEISSNKVNIICQDNAGVSVARNNGIKEAKGEYICFLDADDLWKENHLEVLNDLINRYPEQVVFATSHIATFPSGDKKASSRMLADYKEDFICDNLFFLLNTTCDGVINTNCMCIKKELFYKHNIFFEPNERIGEDTDVWFRFALLYPIVICKEDTTIYRKEFSTATATGSNTLGWIFAKRVESIKRENIPLPLKKECLKLVDRYRMTCSREYICQSNKLAAKRELAKVHYRTWKYYISWLLYYLPLGVSKRLICIIQGE